MSYLCAFVLRLAAASISRVGALPDGTVAARLIPFDGLAAMGSLYATADALDP